VPHITLSKLAHELGFSYSTVWKWYKQGKLRVTRTPSGRLVVPYEEYLRIIRETGGKQDNRNAVIYARIHKLSADSPELDRQVVCLRRYAKENGFNVVEVITDVGSSIDASRKGLRRLLELTASGTIKYVLVTSKDRLATVGIEFLEQLLKSYGVEVIAPFSDKFRAPPEEIVTELAEIVSSIARKIAET